MHRSKLIPSIIFYLAVPAAWCFSFLYFFSMIVFYNYGTDEERKTLRMDMSPSSQHFDEAVLVLFILLVSSTLLYRSIKSFKTIVYELLD